MKILNTSFITFLASAAVVVPVSPGIAPSAKSANSLLAVRIISQAYFVE